MQACWVVDVGLMGYPEAYALQKRIVDARKSGRIEDVLLFCEHPHVITQGRNGKPEHLLASELILRQQGVEFFETSRGGDITYHGPGQVVGYPILNLGAIRRDVAWYVHMLEEAMIRTTAEFGIKAGRVAGRTGIWVGSGTSEEKLGAIGVHLSRWITSHGFAYNVSTDLGYFDWIVPCGIADRKATSLEKLLGRSVALETVKPKLARYLADVFGLDAQESSREKLMETLETAETAANVAKESVQGPAVGQRETTKSETPVLLEKQ